MNILVFQNAKPVSKLFIVTIACQSVLGILLPCYAQQIVKDGTTNTDIDKAGKNFLITGESVNGRNQFHSFQDFSVQADEIVTFRSSDGVQNIINRVTGGNLSKIDGEIRQIGGEANLFLLNPKGIVFGPDSKLDVNASFIASTASSVLFEDETSFDVGPQSNSSLLTSSIPVGLQFGEEAGAIHSQARNSQDPVPVGLGVPTGQTLALIGNGVSITGEPVANSDGFQGYAGITALRGRIEFGSVAQGEKVDLEPVSNRLSDGWTVGYESVESFQEISLSAALLASSSFEARSGVIRLKGRDIDISNFTSINNVNDSVEDSTGAIIFEAAERINVSQGSLVNADTIGPGAAGNIVVRSKYLSVDESLFGAASFDRGAGGEIVLDVDEQIDLSSRAAILTSSFARGKAGSISADTKRLNLSGGAGILSTSEKAGTSGDIDINASEWVEIRDEGSALFAAGQGSGDAGRLNVITGSFSLHDNSEVSVSSTGTGDAGTTTIVADDFQLENGARLSASSRSGSGGNIDIDLQNSLDMKSGSEISTEVGSGDSTSDGGNIDIRAQQLSVIDSNLNSARNGPGAGGQISLDIPELVEVGNSGEVLTTGSGGGDAGSVDITTNRLHLFDGGKVTSQNFETGASGSIEIDAGQWVELQGTDSGLSAEGLGSETAGSLKITTERLTVSDGASASVSNDGIGSAGIFTIKADSLTVEEGGTLSAQTASGNGGNIDIDLQDSLQLRGKSSISTEATSGDSTSEGGNIDIRAAQLSVLDSELNSEKNEPGTGGQISLNVSEAIEVGESGKVLTTGRDGGDAGSVNITTNRLHLSGGSEIASQNSDAGASGSLTINAAEWVELQGTNSSLNASGVDAESAGNVSIKTEHLRIVDGAEASVSNTGPGDAGTLSVSADSIVLDNKGQLSASTDSGNGGDVTVSSAGELELRQGSSISTSVDEDGDGDGGNITIDAQFVKAIPAEDSDIFADAIEGRGGNVTITANGVFGITPREARTELSDITASSQAQLNGVITINSPDIETDRDSLEEPDSAPPPKVVSGCRAGRIRTASSFVDIGRGGLPPDPTQSLGGTAVWDDLRPVVTSRSPSAVSNNYTPKPPQSQPAIVEAQGWIVNEAGEIILTEEAPHAIASKGGFSDRTCRPLPQDS